MRLAEWAEEAMELLLEKVGDVTVVVPKAESFDGNTSREFKEQLPPALGDARKVVLDLHHVQFIDSTGCGATLSALKRLREVGGDLKICCVSSPLRALFDLIRMNGSSRSTRRGTRRSRRSPGDFLPLAALPPPCKAASGERAGGHSEAGTSKPLR